MKTKNQQPYFPHDANYRNRDKMIRLRMVHGVAGYGVYFMLMERLRNDELFETDLDFDVLAYDFDCDQKLIQSVIMDFGLFEVIKDGKRFHSPELTEQMLAMQEAKRKRAEAARAAAEARWGKTVPSDSECGVNAHIDDNFGIVLNHSGGKGLKLDLDREILLLRHNTEWMESVKKEFDLPNNYFSDKFWKTFRDICAGNGLTGGHRSLDDAIRHCYSFVRKINSKKSNKEFDTLNKIEVKHKTANEHTSKKLSTCQSGDNFYRNLGYEPDSSIFRYIKDPEWRKKNPPQHKEWIGRFPGTEKLEDVLIQIESEKLETNYA